MNKIIGVLGIGALGYIVYKYVTNSQGGSFSVSPYSQQNGAYQNAALGGQPSEQYPYQGVNAPRVDNSSQPWYAGSRQFSQGPGSQLPSIDENFAQNVEYLRGAADISKSVGEIWDNLTGFFADDEPEAMTGSFDSFDWTSLESPQTYDA